MCGCGSGLVGDLVSWVSCLLLYTFSPPSLDFLDLGIIRLKGTLV